MARICLNLSGQFAYRVAGVEGIHRFKIISHGTILGRGDPDIEASAFFSLVYQILSIGDWKATTVPRERFERRKTEFWQVVP
jgi:hypothetical protein